MTFSVFRIPVHVQPAFWFTAALLGLNWLMGPKPNFAMFAVWVVVVFVSVMVHELGHAFAIMRHGIAPSISLHWLGGLTSWSGGQRLSRKNRIFISFAGPGAGFILGGIVYGLRAASPEAFAALPSQAQLAVRLVEYVNIFWGLINLIPVLPLDGGHILEDLLGPKRRQATATISLVIGGFVVLFCLMNNQLWIALIFGMMTFQSFQRYREGAPTRAPDPEPLAAEPAHVEPVEPEPLDPVVVARLRTAAKELHNGNYDEAGTMAEQLLDESPPPAVRLEALHLVGWAHLLEGRPEEAQHVVAAIGRMGMIDPALGGAVLFARGRHSEARPILERARALGDERKEVVGPLIQILIAEGEVSRAAALALDIADSLSEDDAKQMAQIAMDHGAHAWASRLFEVVFDRNGSPEDGYEAARLRAMEGDDDGALELLRRAVAAGFSDAARLWSDAALEKLRGGEVGEALSELLPQPDPSEHAGAET